MFQSCVCLLSLLFLLGGGPSVAWAGPGSNVSPPAVGAENSLAPSPPADNEAIRLRVHGDFSLAELEKLSASLEGALGRPVALSLTTPQDASQLQLTVTFHPENRELAVALTDAGGSTISRVLEAPAEREQVLEAAVLLAQNLYVRQAPEVLLAARQEPAETPSQAPPSQAQVQAVALPAAPLEPAVVNPEGSEALLDPIAPEPELPTPGPYRFANVAFFYPLSTNAHLPHLKTHLDVSLLHSRVGEVDGLQLGTVNAISNRLAGLQLGALINEVAGPASGVQLAGLMNFSGEVSPALQVAFGMNRAAEGGRGAQVALGLNLSGGSFAGVQTSMGFNHHVGRYQGVQVGGLFNRAKGFRGLQASAGANIAANVQGVQLGLVNVGQKVEGLQVGLVNIAEDVEGVPIGLFNVTESGGLHVPVWWSNHSSANVGLKFATRYTYTLIGASGVVGTDENRFGPFFALGVRIPTLPKAAIDIDVYGTYQLGTRLCCYDSRRQERLAHARDRSYYGLRVLPNYSLHKHLSLFLGGGLGVRIPFAVYSNFEESNRDIELVPEVLGGVEF